ncbi:hypothetical protein CTEN210_14173 [Chaetoceros tenuissimus]|uniref:S1 motif domain-containing protein n=1 Tax=Chaetoceros tenuissimus TaxID=426638 RepID=A0AAD3D572_9STRA|nr:hypothetical protein CTEN210_14173 [Chaetoceros tenuissimus]
MASYQKLSRAWVKCKVFAPASKEIQMAIERTLPLLHDDPTAVPFICRYRTDVIEPLTTKHVHHLSDCIQKYDSLSTLRNKILPHLQSKDTDDMDNKELISRVETSISKTELEDIYAPFKPPSKGSLEDRIRSEHPELVRAIDDLWSKKDVNKNTKYTPRDAAITLLANRIANDVDVIDAIMKHCEAHCKISTKAAAKSKKRKLDGQKLNSKETHDKYTMYHDFSNSLKYLRDHQVLAIRRGVDKKELKMSFEIDNGRIERIIGGVISRSHPLYKDAIHDAFSRLLRKRCTLRVWKDRCALAESRAIEVFCENLYKAMLEPPATISSTYILVLDPGFQAGIKCAILKSSGAVERLETIKYMGNSRTSGKRQLKKLLCDVNSLTGNNDVCVILGNGHGTREVRELVLDSSKEANMPVDIRLVNEAGASVWSVTENAMVEFPKETAASIASVSIGRRFLNPLHELVKIPPRSLGLGMYQHDLSMKDLDKKLSITSTEAVAEVGVDINICSKEILSKVPSLNSKLCTEIIENGKEALDNTLIHPESYDIARYLLKKLNWQLGNKDSLQLSGKKSEDEREIIWRKLGKKASKRFSTPEERCYTIIEQLYYSILNPDPRLRRTESTAFNSNSIANEKSYSKLPSHITNIQELQKALPLRAIAGTVRNVVDFGVFIDFAFEHDGLLHRSKLGNVSLHSLLIGQEIGIDILGVSSSGKISLSLHGLDFPMEILDDKSKTSRGKRKLSSR